MLNTTTLSISRFSSGSLGSGCIRRIQMSLSNCSCRQIRSPLIVGHRLAASWVFFCWLCNFFLWNLFPDASRKPILPFFRVVCSSVSPSIRQWHLRLYLGCLQILIQTPIQSFWIGWWPICQRTSPHKSHGARDVQVKHMPGYAQWRIGRLNERQIHENSRHVMFSIWD